MITLHNATVDDVPRISTLAALIWRESYPGIISDDQIDYMLNMMYDVDVLRHELVDENVRYYLLTDSDLDVGFVAWGPGPTLTPLSGGEGAGERSAKIHKLYLRRDRQGQGLGRMMLEHAVDQARLAGYPKVVLNVNKHNDHAIATYLRNGFTIRKSIVVDIGGGYVMDDYVMERSTSTPRSGEEGQKERSPQV